MHGATRRTAIAVVFLFVLSPFAAAGDISGKWSGFIDLKDSRGQSNRLQAFAEFKQQGKTVTGTFGPTLNQQFSISQGMIRDRTFTFQVAAPKRIFKFNLALKRKHLQGRVESEDGSASGEVDFARGK